ncbi:class I glutamine amidotransferase-like protein [Pilobolus umbonatus]|nr:class I glutamine amidotransferase-like protein [Pilobolus umbonatus]
MRRSIRLALLKCDTPMPIVKDTYGDYYPIFLNIFNKAADKEGIELQMEGFDVVHEGEYPSSEDIQSGKYDGIIITGSSHNAHDNDPWILKLIDFLQKIRSGYEGNKTRIIGICFGHQVLLRACGGLTGRNPEGWEVGYIEVQLNTLGRQLLHTDKTFMKIHQFHRDHVSILPADFKSWAFTDNTPNHATVSDDSQCITIQGHPEFNKDIMRKMIMKRIENGILTEEYGKACLDNLDKNNITRMDDVWITDRFIEFLTR